MTDKSEFAEAAEKAKESRALTKRESQELALPDQLDWKQWSLPVTARILSRIPHDGGRDGDYYLTQEQSAIWAIVSFEQKLSPFTGETWFNPKNNKVNLTLQGKLNKARHDGLRLGAPTFKRLPEDVTKPVIAYKCILPTSNGNVEYTATLAEWEMPHNPNWRNRKEHMLQVRAYEKAVSFAAGVGASEDPGEQDLSVGDVPEISSTPVDFTPAPEPVPVSTINPEEE